MIVACREPDGYSGSVPTFGLEEFAHLGSVDEEGSALSSVAGLARTDSGVVVLERDPPRVAIFGLDGTWRRDLAGAGDGPGELRAPTLIGVLENDIWVGDPFGGRLEVMSSEGTALRSYRWDVEPDDGGVRAFPTAPLSGGAILAGPGPLSLGGVVSGRTRHRTYYRAGPDGTVLAVLYEQPLAPSDYVSAPISTGGAFVGIHPIQESPLVAVYPDGSGLVVVDRAASQSGDEARWRLRVIAVDGTVETDREILYIPVSAAGWLERRLRETERDMMRRSGSVNRALLDALRETWTDRRFYPPVTAVVAGEDGSIWVRREDSGADSLRVEVFARDGSQVGQLALPARMTMLWASRDELWVVDKNDLDVPFVLGMRVRVGASAQPN